MKPLPAPCASSRSRQAEIAPFELSQTTATQKAVGGSAWRTHSPVYAHSLAARRRVAAAMRAVAAPPYLQGERKGSQVTDNAPEQLRSAVSSSGEHAAQAPTSRAQVAAHLLEGHDETALAQSLAINDRASRTNTQTAFDAASPGTLLQQIDSGRTDQDAHVLGNTMAEMSGANAAQASLQSAQSSAHPGSNGHWLSHAATVSMDEAERLLSAATAAEEALAASMHGAGVLLDDMSRDGGDRSIAGESLPASSMQPSCTGRKEVHQDAASTGNMQPAEVSKDIQHSNAPAVLPDTGAVYGDTAHSSITAASTAELTSPHTSSGRVQPQQAQSTTSRQAQVMPISQQPKLEHPQSSAGTLQCAQTALLPSERSKAHRDVVHAHTCAADAAMSHGAASPSSAVPNAAATAAVALQAAGSTATASGNRQAAAQTRALPAPRDGSVLSPDGGGTHSANRQASSLAHAARQSSEPAASAPAHRTQPAGSAMAKPASSDAPVASPNPAPEPSSFAQPTAPNVHTPLHGKYADILAELKGKVGALAQQADTVRAGQKRQLSVLAAMRRAPSYRPSMPGAHSTRVHCTQCASLDHDVMCPDTKCSLSHSCRSILSTGTAGI